MSTLEQKIAKKQDELARLKDKQRKLENGQKIVIGGMMMALAKKDKKIASALLGYIETEVTRKPDLDRLAPFIDELKGMQ